MKKILAFLICIVTVATAMLSAFTVSGASVIDARELESYGQKHFYLGSPNSSKPNTKDAKVNSGEYAAAYKYKKGDSNTIFSKGATGVSQFDNEWFRMSFSYSNDTLYLAYETKDNNWQSNKDGFSWYLSLADRGTTIDAFSAIAFDCYPGGNPTDPKTVNGVRITPRNLKRNDDSSMDSRIIYRELFVRDVSGNYDESTKVLTIEIAINIDALKEFWGNSLYIGDARLYLTGLSYCYGSSATGIENSVSQGMVWSCLPGNSTLKNAFSKAYPKITFWGTPTMYFPHIIHFNDGKPHSHKWDEGLVTKPASHLTEGTIVYTCEECGETKEDVIPVVAHNWNEGTVTKPATNDSEGTMLYTCIECKATKTETIPRLPVVVTTAPPASEPPQNPDKTEKPQSNTTVFNTQFTDKPSSETKPIDSVSDKADDEDEEKESGGGKSGIVPVIIVVVVVAFLGFWLIDVIKSKKNIG